MNTLQIRPFAALKLFTFAALSLGGCHVAGIKGNGNITTENHAVPTFSEVQADGAFSIEWAAGAPAVKVTTDENLQRYIDAEVTGKRLRLHSRNSLRSSDGIRIAISSPGLTAARLTGAVKFTGTKLSGSGFFLDATGATRVNIDGGVDQLMASMTGASRLDAATLQCQSASLAISGAGRADVAAAKTLKVTISGAGKVTYSGNPTVEKEISGAGSVRQRE